MLNQEQEHVVESVTNGKNVFVTGSAGTGKSYLIDHITRQLTSNYQILASTGVAAINVGGLTIHKFFALRIETRTLKDYLKYCLKKSTVNWKSLKVLIIDEISMISPYLFKLVDQICRFHKQNEIAFGGIQVVLVGDFFQLSPIPDKLENSSETFIFETKTWTELQLEIYQLNIVMRQDDEAFIKILNKIRVGKIDQDVLQFINECQSRPLSESTLQLFAKNVYKNEANQTRLSSLTGESRTYYARDTGDSKCLSGLLAETKLQLKIGAQVMSLKNDTALGLSNGSLGIIQDFDKNDGLPIVKFNSSDTELKMELYKWEIKKRLDNGNFSTIATRKQVPLVLAYALSIHKSQGLTLDKLETDLHDIFANGQLYVALSRASTKEGLTIKNFKPEYIKINSKVLDFYSKNLINYL
jgi:ATP-dependent DNA helicase PIF1